MTAVDKFRQEKTSFVMMFFIYALLSFLAVCSLFGVYIWRSFDNGTQTITQTQDGEYNKQGIANGSISIY